MENSGNPRSWWETWEARLRPSRGGGAPRRWLGRAIATTACASLVLTVEGGCLNRPVGTDQPRTTNFLVDSVQQNRIEKVDLLLMIDNSGSMADKQTILAQAVPRLVERLVNPGCVDAEGVLHPEAQPVDADAACPPDLGREFTPLRDINVAVITSSLGDAGASTATVPQACPPTPQAMANGVVDNAHLLASLRVPAELASGSPLLNPLGFIEWRGENQPEFERVLRGLTTTAGERGCGFEASLEAWYRFLVDPQPYLTLERVDCPSGTKGGCVARQGTDDILLAQRAAFLRDDSLVLTLMLTDENDCSIRVGAQNWFVAAQSFLELAPTSACSVDPNDRCCHSCGQTAPEGCPATDSLPECIGSDGKPRQLSELEDAMNLRCIDQKRRFGVDFLYPIERYVNALREPRLCLARADLNPSPAAAGEIGCQDSELVDNPLFRRTDPVSGLSEITRGQELVFLAGIVGVPWQLIRADADPDGVPYPANELRFLTSAQLGNPSSPGNTRGTSWQTLRSDPHLSEGPDIRPSLPPPTAASPLADPIHGHERNLPERDDLQYSCIFDLPEGEPSRDCSAAGVASCDCKPGEQLLEEMNPLCQADDGSYSTLQRRAKAFPGLRQLDVLERVGTNSILASICARNVRFATEPNAQDLGYQPAVDAIVDRLKGALARRCVPRPLDVTVPEAAAEPTASAPCSLVEVEFDRTEPCDCSTIGGAGTRVAPSQPVDRAVRGRARQLFGTRCADAGCSNACVCDLRQAEGDALRACQYEVTPPEGASGWCYVAPDDGLGNPALVDGCEANQRQTLRFVPEGLLRSGATTFIACFGAAPADDGRVVQPTGARAGGAAR